jgi:hypothetical protein
VVCSVAREFIEKEEGMSHAQDSRCSRTTRALVAMFFVCSVGSPQLMAAGNLVWVAENPVPTEKNPPGDIPDDQVFLSYHSPLGFTLQVPEGWSRTDRADGTRFFDKYDVIEATVTPASAAPSEQSVRSREAAELVANGRAAKIGSIKEMKLKGGPAVRITYTANSEPNAVTNKQVRLEHERFIFFKDGRLATIDFAAPAGADNADQWQLMSNSFRWN